MLILSQWAAAWRIWALPGRAWRKAVSRAFPFGVAYAAPQGLAIIGTASDIVTKDLFTIKEWSELEPSTFIASSADNRYYRMKREISDLFGEEYARLAVILNGARGWAKDTLPTYQDRKEFFEGIVNGDPDPVELIRDSRETEVLALIEAAQERATSAMA